MYCIYSMQVNKSPIHLVSGDPVHLARITVIPYVNWFGFEAIS